MCRDPPKLLGMSVLGASSPPQLPLDWIPPQQLIQPPTRNPRLHSTAQGWRPCYAPIHQPHCRYLNHPPQWGTPHQLLHRARCLPVFDRRSAASPRCASDDCEPGFSAPRLNSSGLTMVMRRHQFSHLGWTVVYRRCPVAPKRHAVHATRGCWPPVPTTQEASPPQPPSTHVCRRRVAIGSLASPTTSISPVFTAKSSANVCYPCSDESLRRCWNCGFAHGNPTTHTGGNYVFFFLTRTADFKGPCDCM